MVVDLQQPAALSVKVERELLPAARQNRIPQPVQMQGGDVDNIIDQDIVVKVLQLVDGAGCGGAFRLRVIRSSEKLIRKGYRRWKEKGCTNSVKKSVC